MKLIAEKFKHMNDGFILEVVTCNSGKVTTLNKDTNETVIFHRPKFEWMVTKKIFEKI